MFLRPGPRDVNRIMVPFEGSPMMKAEEPILFQILPFNFLEPCDSLWKFLP